MDREQIKEVCRDVFGRNHEMKDLGTWVGMKCVLAPWTHQKGHDSSPSAGVLVDPNGTSIYNCLAAETEVITWEGVRPIAELAGGVHKVLTPGGVWRDAPFMQYPDAELFKVTLSRNGVTKEVCATANHRWFKRAGAGRALKEVVTEALRPKDRLPSVLPAKPINWTMDREGFLHGVVFGDGTAVKGSTHGRVMLFGEKMQLTSYLNVPGTHHSRSHATDTTPAHRAVSGRLAHMKSLPREGASDEYLLGFLAGYIATDGCVSEEGNVTLHSSKKGDLKWVRDTAMRLGLSTYHIGVQSRKGYRAYDTRIYKLNFVNSTLAPELFLREDQRSRYTEGLNREYERTGWQVLSVEATGRVEPVYCAEVPEVHAFALADNLLTGNCFTCGNPKPFHAMLKDYADYSGEDLDDLIGELEEGEFLGPRNTLSYDAIKASRTSSEGMAMPIDEGLFMTLFDPAEGHWYLEDRGISRETARKLELRFDPEDSEGEPRILFPVRGPDGLLYGFSGRAIYEDARLKVRDYHGLVKAASVLGSHLVTATDQVLVVEGLFDYANAHQCGYTGCAVMHSTMTDLQAEIIRNLGRPAFLFYDADDAGYKGVVSARKRLVGHVPTFEVVYPRVKIEDDSDRGWHWLKDPGEMIPEDFEAMLNKAELL